MSSSIALMIHYNTDDTGMLSLNLFDATFVPKVDLMFMRMGIKELA